ncbi:hypothetical protein DB313_05575 (plasmid) [Borrelia turcica IST7]|uniref:Plasmid partition protein putative N-terminal domain-containing protein n=2 Tax=Borrelia turcica TaxID=229155 RepID=A0A386PN85_9SPIR|nr:hypothetical protein DB313_05575 [Borrelia turcica IST7]
MEIMYDIKKRELYKYDNYKSFSAFLRYFSYNEATIYRYIRVYTQLLNGKIKIEDIHNNGIAFIFLVFSAYTCSLLNNFYKVYSI